MIGISTSNDLSIKIGEISQGIVPKDTKRDCSEKKDKSLKRMENHDKL
jgi:hypothetical protein